MSRLLNTTVRNSIDILNAFTTAEVVTSMQLAERVSVTPQYAQKLVNNLKRLGYVVPKRGRGGGYLLNGSRVKSASIADLIYGLDKQVALVGIAKAPSEAVEKDLEEYLQHLPVIRQVPNQGVLQAELN